MSESAGRNPPSDAGEDAALVAGTKKGEAEAFERLFVKYRQPVFAVAFRMVRHEDAAMDIVQETFIKAYENIGMLREGERVLPWLRRIAANLAIDSIRRRRRSGEKSLEEELEEEDGGGKVVAPPAEGSGPAEEAEDSEFAAALWNALDELPESQRAVFMLHAVEKMTYREVAETMGCSIGTVMSRLHYARKKLQEILKSHIASRTGEDGRRQGHDLPNGNYTGAARRLGR
jgi:RNA polymerase sigma-70 factor (ECF subfamily)